MLTRSNLQRSPLQALPGRQAAPLRRCVPLPLARCPGARSPLPGRLARPAASGAFASARDAVRGDVQPAPWWERALTVLARVALAVIAVALAFFAPATAPPARCDPSA